MQPHGTTRAIRIPMECPICHIAFEVSRLDAERGRRYCSDASRDVGKADPANTIDCTCGWCGEHFPTARANWLNNEGQYCRKEHFYEARRAGVHVPLPRADRPCEVCETVYSATQRAIDAGEPLYCTKACRKVAKPPMVERVCETCGDTFWAKTANVKIGKGRYCQRSCVPRAKTEAEKAYLSEVRTGMTFTDEHKASLSKAWETREPASEETRAKIGNAHRSMVRPEGTGAKISAALTGHPLSSEHRATLSEAHKGYVMPVEQRRKIAVAHTGRPHDPASHRKAIATKRERGTLISGPAHPWYKHGRAKFAYRYYDPRYAAWRKQILKRDENICQACFEPCDTWEHRANSHHILNYALYPFARYILDNGVCIGHSCHREIHGLNPKPNPTVECECGCGVTFSQRGLNGRDRRFVRGHSARKPRTTI